MNVNIKRINPNYPLPAYQTQGACCFDIYSRKNETIKPNERKLLPSNFIIQVPEGFVLLILPRSSFGKKGLLFPHSVGVIDSDYCGENDEIFIQVVNNSQKNIEITAGERIAQGMILPCPTITFTETTWNAENRGGFGSTGKNA